MTKASTRILTSAGARQFQQGARAAAVLAALLLCATPTAMAAQFPTDLLPPPGGVYTGVNSLVWATGAQLRNVVMSGFTGNVAPPGLGGSVTRGFSSGMAMDVSTDGGYSWTPTTASVSGGALATTHDHDAGGVSYYKEEMMWFSTSYFRGIWLRESPSIPSPGQTTIEHEQDGSYEISSFFDIFVEISLDGGQFWSQPVNNTPLRVTIDPLPEPSSLMSLLAGIVGVGGLAGLRRIRGFKA